MRSILTFSILITLPAVFTGCKEGTHQPAPPAPAAVSKSSDGTNSPADAAMMDEASKGNTAAVKGWLERGVAVNMRGPSKNTPIMEAAFAGHVETVKLLLDHGADLSAKKSDGETVVSLGARHKDIVQLFKDVSALVEAARNGDNKALKSLIDKGTPLNGLNEGGQSALTEASWNGKTDTVKLLLEKGADPNIKKPDGESPLSIAMSRKHQDVIALLKEAIAKGAKSTPTATP